MIDLSLAQISDSTNYKRSPGKKWLEVEVKPLVEQVIEAMDCDGVETFVSFPESPLHA